MVPQFSYDDSEVQKEEKKPLFFGKKNGSDRAGPSTWNSDSEFNDFSYNISKLFYEWVRILRLARKMCPTVSPDICVDVMNWSLHKATVYRMKAGRIP